MASRLVVEEFMAQKRLAVVGVSRGGKKFGNTIFRELKSRGYTVIPIHPEAEQVEGERAYPNLKSLPEAVSAVVVVVPPAQTETVVREAVEAGINRIWMQPGAESSAAISFCEAQGVKLVQGECIIMHQAKIGFPHNFHHWVNKVTGKLPQ